MKDKIINQLQKIDFIKSVREITDDSILDMIQNIKSNKEIKSTIKNKLIDDIKINSTKIKVFEIFYKVGKIDVVGYIAISNKLDIKKKNPVIISLRGGSRDLGKMTLLQFYSNIANKFFLINKGYVFITTQYRGVAGGAGIDEMGGKDLNDCIKLFEIVRKLRFCDKNRIGLFGMSRGGQMIFQLLKEEIKVKTAVVGVGCTNHIRMIQEDFRPDWKAHCERMFGGSIAGLKKRSAVYWADKIQRIPILMFYSKNDVRVNVQDGIDLHKMLPQSKLIIYDDDHIFTKNHLDMKKKTLFWLKKYL